MSGWTGPKNISKENPGDWNTWSDNDIRKLVRSYRRNPCLWRENDAFYLVAERRLGAYERIHRDMMTCRDLDVTRAATLVEIMMKLREIRNLYVAELKKILQSKVTCCRYKPTSKWFYDLHHFLYPHLDYDEMEELQNIIDGWLITNNRKNSCDASCRFKRKADSLKEQSDERSKRPYSTKVTYRAANAFVPSRDSCTDYVSSSSDIAADSSSSTIIRENKSSYDRQVESSSDASSETGSTYNCTSNKSIRRTKRLLAIPKPCRTTGHDEIEIFAKQVACQLRKMESCSALRARNDIRKILDDRNVHSNFNVCTDSRGNVVSQARTVSRTIVPCRVSIPIRHDLTGFESASAMRGIHRNNDRLMENEFDSIGRSVRSRNIHQNRGTMPLFYYRFKCHQCRR